MEISKCCISELLFLVFFFLLREPAVKHLAAHYCTSSITLSHLDPFQQHSNLRRSFLPSLKKPQPPHILLQLPSLFSFTAKLPQRTDYISWIHLVISQSFFHMLKPFFATTSPLKQLLLSSMTSMDPKVYEQFSLTSFDLLAVFNSVDLYLLEILLSLDFGGPWSWFSSNLSSFSFAVPFSGSSSWNAVVFQGSVLGPLLYFLPRSFHLFPWPYTLPIHQWLLDL